MTFIPNKQNNLETIIWKSITAQTIAHEKRFAIMLKSLFSKQEKEVLSNAKRVNLSRLSNIKSEEYMLPFTLERSGKKYAEYKGDVDLVLDKITFDKKVWDEKFIKSSVPLYTAIVQQSGKRVFSQLNLGIDFDSEDLAIRKFIRNKAIKFSGFVNNETEKRLNRIIKPIILRGGSVEDVRVKIQNAVNKVYTSSVRGAAPRARMIARTEMISSSNGSSLEAMKQSKVVKFKAWLTSRDLKVRDTHIAAGIKYSIRKGIPLNKPFRIGAALLSAPGNAVGGSNTAKETINCRCTLVSTRIGKGKI